MNYTPGPWTFSPQEGKPGHCHLAQVWDNTGHNLAEVEPTEDEKEATSNARLIAAAPDLLEALQAMLSRFESLDNGYLRADLVKGMAKSAIQKATV